MSNPFDILTDIVQREIGSTSDKQLSKEHSRIVADTLIKELNEANILLAPVPLEDIVADFLCTRWDWEQHEHEAFLQDDHCEQGLYDAKKLVAYVRRRNNETYLER